MNNIQVKYEIIPKFNKNRLPVRYALILRAAVVHFRAGSTFPVPVCTVSPGYWVNIADTQ